MTHRIWYLLLVVLWVGTVSACDGTGDDSSDPTRPTNGGESSDTEGGNVDGIADTAESRDTSRLRDTDRAQDGSSSPDLTDRDVLDTTRDGETSSADSGSDGMDDAGGDGGTTVACGDRTLPTLTTTEIAPNHTFDEPLYVTQPPGESNTLYVVERAGRILQVQNGAVQSPPFLDIRNRVDSQSNRERGLLGLAFHPNYSQNGRFFINYTPAGSRDYNVVAEYRRSSKNPETADSNEVRRLVEKRDTQGNHNGGMITFGPDGYLYVAMGDGGGAGDRGAQHAPDGNGQTITNIFGTLLRLDVDASGRNFAAPDNPFVGRRGDDRIWAYGLRNPWRFAFDSKTGDLYIADVGQNKFGEIDVQPASSSGGENYGWRAYEANDVFDPSLASNVSNHQEPILGIPHDSRSAKLRSACSVTGGYVYRGSEIPQLRGYYLYGDFCSSDIAALRYCNGSIQDHERLSGLTGSVQQLASFGEDNAGELYMVDYIAGSVLKLETP